jgi:anti-sigma-K factor RskA
MMAQSKDAADRAPSEIEELLPFHAAGTLNMHDARRVEEAMARDPDLARQYAEIQEEFAETIALNESLGAPSARAMQKLFEAIDAEPARSPAASFNPLSRVAGFFASLSPRTLAYAAVAGAFALLLQAGVIGTLVKDRPASYQTASSNSETGAGAMALVRFAPDARLGDITQFLDSYHASIVSGPKAGMFRIRFSDKALSKQETDQLIARVQSEKVVTQALPAE